MHVVNQYYFDAARFFLSHQLSKRVYDLYTLFLCSLTYSLICSHVHTPALTPVRITIVSLFFPCFVCSSYLITFLAPATDAPVFDLSGRRVVKVVKGGLYIQNGKKFIVK